MRATLKFMRGLGACRLCRVVGNSCARYVMQQNTRCGTCTQTPGSTTLPRTPQSKTTHASHKPLTRNTATTGRSVYLKICHAHTTYQKISSTSNTPDPSQARTAQHTRVRRPAQPTAAGCGPPRVPAALHPPPGSHRRSRAVSRQSGSRWRGRSSTAVRGRGGRQEGSSTQYASDVLRKRSRQTIALHVRPCSTALQMDGRQAVQAEQSAGMAATGI